MIKASSGELVMRDEDFIVSKTNPQGKITYCNKVFIEFSEFNEGELLGQPHNIIRHPDMPKDAFKDMWNTIQAGNMWYGKVKNRAKDGSTYYVIASVFPLYENDDEKISGYIAIRFLTTDEEIEKREFQKKVISNLSELRKKDYKLKHSNLSYQNEIMKLKEKVNILNNKINKNHKNVLSQDKQIEYYEKQLEENNDKLIRLLETKRKELENYIDTNKKMKNEKTELMKKNEEMKNYIKTLESINNSNK